ncbi:MAG: hypothetical protein FD149_1319 [Rhodospirillaceae bacterium]|nr:MAG: hypothetical protein FD149_1319 [Rhodospirillaceae bacterium]
MAYPPRFLLCGGTLVTQGRKARRGQRRHHHVLWNAAAHQSLGDARVGAEHARREGPCHAGQPRPLMRHLQDQGACPAHGAGHDAPEPGRRGAHQHNIRPKGPAMAHDTIVSVNLDGPQAGLIKSGPAPPG